MLSMSERLSVRMDMSAMTVNSTRSAWHHTGTPTVAFSTEQQLSQQPAAKPLTTQGMHKPGTCCFCALGVGLLSTHR